MSVYKTRKANQVLGSFVELGVNNWKSPF